MLRRLFGAAVAVAVFATPVAAIATGTDKGPVQLLFETPHMDLVNKGHEVIYHYEHKVSDEKVLGSPYADDISVGVVKVDAEGKRDVTMQVFRGARARDPWSETGLTLNPIFVWYLNNSVSLFRTMAGGDPAYLKDRFSKAFIDKAKMEPIKSEFDGKQVDAYRVTVQPYIDDNNTKKMDGYEKSSFEIVFSPSVPGYFLEMIAKIESKREGSPQMSDRLTFVKMGELK